MDAFWVEALVAAISGTLGAVGTAAAMAPRLRQCQESPLPQEVIAPPRQAPSKPRPRPTQLYRCEQAVRRAERAIDTVSSTSARQALQLVVRRMEAELPNLRALVELSHSLESGTADPHAIERVREQLDDAAVRFRITADRVLEVVVQHVAEPDLNQLHAEVAGLRQRFPLLRPMSAVVCPRPAEPELADLPA